MTHDKQKPIAPQAPSDDERPEIYGIKKGENGIVFNRRSFLGAFAVAGALASCRSRPAAKGKGVPTEQRKGTPTEQRKGTPDASTPGCGSSKAHESQIDGLSMQDKLLFSWDGNTLKAWEFTKGSLKKSLTKNRLKEDLKKNADTFPDLFLRLWDAPLVAHGPGGKMLAVNSRDGIALWKSVKRKLSKSMTLKGAAQPVRSLAFHPGGTLFAAGSEDGSITLWSLKGGKVQQRFQGASGPALSLAVHPNGALLLSGHPDGKVRMWQLPEGQAGQTLSDHGSGAMNVKITPNGALAVTSGGDGLIKLWNVPDGAAGNTLPFPGSEKVTAMDLSQDGQILAVGTAEGHIYLWQLPEGKMTGCLFDPALVQKDTQMAQYRQMGAQILTQACDKPLPAGATCVCDCIAANLSYRTPQTVCICDTSAVPAGYAVPDGVCICNTIAVGSKPGPCGCVAHVTRGGSHYWRPN